MLSSLLDHLVAKNAFAREARSLGLSSRVTRLLEPAALHVSPDAPERVLHSRELMERASLWAALGDGGNLELSFARVDLLAGAIEVLRLTRTTDVPDPFRRVWISDARGGKTRGVALTCENGEVAVFCPPDGKPISDEAEGRLRLGYRGFASPVEIELQLCDSCLFPGGRMLHLRRSRDAGHVGRGQERFDVSLDGQAKAVDGDRWTSCAVADISSGGVRMECEEAFPVGQRVALTLLLPDDEAAPFTCTADVRWSRPADPGRQAHGLMFRDLPASQVQRLERFLERARARTLMPRETVP